MAVDRLRSLIATNGAYIKSQDGVADEFADETGINLDIEGALIAQSTGTVIGDFTNGNYAFNSAIAAAGGTLATTTTATDQKIGKLYTTPIALASIEMKAPSNAGYVNGGNAITMTIMGSEDTTNGSDGTWVAISAATAVAMAAGSTNVITCTDTVTLFKGVVMNCTRTDGTTISVAEMEITSATIVGGTINTTYNAGGDYYHNPAGGQYSLLSNIDGAVYSHSSTHPGDYGAANAFNGDGTASRWASNAGTSSGYIRIDLGAGNEQTLVKIIMTTGAGGNMQGVDGFTFRGSNNGSSYTTLYTMANGTSVSVFGSGTGLATVPFTFTNTTAYRYYLCNVTQVGIPGARSIASIHELEGYGAVTDPALMTLVSNTFTAQTAPSEASLVLLHQPISSVTLNTDVLAYISRDGGTTYTQGTLASGGEYSTGINILTINGLDISAQPSGTNMKYKIVTANVKEQRFHGAWLQWS
tara:strand:+ start:7506 stop:8918 length:1413 start_codon:yes stop_codon:yes gene_type:complete